MTQVTNILNGVAPFPMETFRSYSEFESYLTATDAKRGLRWLHERSLASMEKTVAVRGTCGLCLTPTTFTAPTHGGESAPNGRVPNWREGLHCGCEYRLFNRQRALLHLLAAEGFLRSWTRILLLGEAQALRPFLSATSDHVQCSPGSLDEVLGGATPPRGGYHVILSAEQLTARLARREVFLALRALLAPGGALAITAPFDIHAPGSQPGDSDRIDWRVLGSLAESGFLDAKVCTYWSEEFGYLGAFNMIITANRV
jgi:hypothetical protein